MSTQEAIWHGIPIIGMPFAYDQHKVSSISLSKSTSTNNNMIISILLQNLMRLIKFGFAEKIDFHTMTTSHITEVLRKILDDPKYSLNAKNMSRKYKDQKENPLDRAIWWIEWLLRNPNCDYLRSPVLHLGLIIGNSYDVVAFIVISSILLLIILIGIFVSCLRKSFNLLTSKSQTKLKTF